jgi:chromosome segregation ATPase
MSRKLTTAACLILSFMMISWLAQSIADEGREARVGELQERIQELEQALARETNGERKLELKGALEEHHQALRRLKTSQEPRGESSELGMAIKQTQEQIVKLQTQMDAATPERRKELEPQLARKKAQLQELMAHLERQRAGREWTPDKQEVRIRQIQGAIKELRYGLEHHPDSEKAESWRKSLREYEQQLERLMAERNEVNRLEGEFSELRQAIAQTEREIEVLTHRLEDMEASGVESEESEEIERELHRRERHLEELIGALEERQADTRPQAKLVIFRLEHANVLSLGDVIERFLTHAGVIAADVESNSLIIRDTLAGLKDAETIIKALDVPKRKRTQ